MHRPSIHPSIHNPAIYPIFAEYLLGYSYSLGLCFESETDKILCFYKAYPLVKGRWTVKLGAASDCLVLGSVIWEGFSEKVAGRILKNGLCMDTV